MTEQLTLDFNTPTESITPEPLTTKKTKSPKSNKRKQEKQLTPEDILIPKDEQPYELPENWRWLKLRGTVNLIAGNAFPKELQGVASEKIPFFKVGNLKEANYNGYLSYSDNTISEQIRQKIKANIIPAKSVIFAKIGEAIRLNKRAILEVDACIDNNLMAMCPNEELLNYKFLYIWSKTQDFYQYAQASAIPSIRKSTIEGILFPLPPLAEQARIVARLESLLGKIREARELLVNEKGSFALRKAAILASVLDETFWQKNLLNDKHQTLNMTISQVAEATFDGPFGSNLKSDDYTDSGIRVIRLENIGHMFFEDSKETYISPEKYTTLTKHTLKTDDILFSSFVAEEVRVCLFPKKNVSAINKADCFCIRVDQNKCLPKFLLYKLASYKTYLAMKNNSHGATRPRINLKQLKQYEFKMPSLENQWKIVRIIDHLLNLEEQALEQIENMETELDTLEKSILAQAFRGELGTNDPTDSPIDLTSLGQGKD